MKLTETLAHAISRKWLLENSRFDSVFNFTERSQQHYRMGIIEDGKAYPRLTLYSSIQKPVIQKFVTLEDKMTVELVGLGQPLMWNGSPFEFEGYLFNGFEWVALEDLPKVSKCGRPFLAQPPKGWFCGVSWMGV